MPAARIHLHLRTRKLEASRAFYTALFGPPDKASDEIVRFQPEDLGISLTLMNGDPGPLHPDEHQGIKWEDVAGARAAWARLEAAGLAGDSTEEAVNCCGAVQDKRWFLDPDGRAWELYAVLDDAPEGPFVDGALPRPGCCGEPAESAFLSPAQASTGCCG